MENQNKEKRYMVMSDIYHKDHESGAAYCEIVKTYKEALKKYNEIKNADIFELKHNNEYITGDYVRTDIELHLVNVEEDEEEIVDSSTYEKTCLSSKYIKKASD